MQLVWITALGVGGATMIGALLGLFIKQIPHRYNDAILGFAAGIMLAAAIFGLILPVVQDGKITSVIIAVIGVFVGALCLSAMDRFVPHLHNIAGASEHNKAEDPQVNKVLLFVFAVAIHNLPEGIAAGVSFGTGHVEHALTVAGGIALQNIPEGMVIIAPMLAAGVSRRRTLLIAFSTGAIEIIGTLLGYLFVAVSNAVLPFALAFAGGTMLYVISDEMIPETHAHGYEKSATFAVIIGFCVMLLLDAWIG